jgi:hypothetical protein
MADARTQRKLALLVGINRYPFFPRRQLQGCLNDVALMAETLRSVFGFPQEQMTFLRDEKATRKRILEAMNNLLNAARPDDIVVFYYAGHGSRVHDREGDEVDGWDETIVPSDSGRSPNPFKDITDDEIYLWLLALTQKTPYVTLIFDSCHSGDITRDSFGDAARGIEPEERSLDELPPSPVPAAQLPLLLAGTREVGPSGWLPRGQRHVLIAGCRHNQFTYETRQGGLDYGRMTYALNQELLNAVAGTTYRDVFERVSLAVSSQSHDQQHPQLEGARDRELFGVHDIAPAHFVGVKKRNAQIVLLAAGQAHGLTAGSQWAIYAQTIKTTSEQSRLGVVEVLAPQAVTAEARIVAETRAGAIVPLTRAVEIAHNYGDMWLKVYLSKEASQLKQLLSASPALRLVEARDDAEVQISLVQPRTQVQAFDPVPQLGAISEAIWAVVDRTGQLVMPVQRQRERQAVSLLLENLEKRVRYDTILNLRNRGGQDVLHGKLVMQLLQRNVDGTWRDATVDPVSNSITYQDGDMIAIRVTNYHALPVYCCLLDMGLAGTISLLYPEPGSNKALSSGHTLQVGVRVGDEIQLYIPTVEHTVASLPLKEEETFKLIAITYEADFSLFAQDSYRGERERVANDPFSQLLEMAWNGSRDTRRPAMQPMDTWTTVEKSFRLLPAQ